MQQRCSWWALCCLNNIWFSCIMPLPVLTASLWQGLIWSNKYELIKIGAICFQKHLNPHRHRWNIHHHLWLSAEVISEQKYKGTSYSLTTEKNILTLCSGAWAFVQLWAVTLPISRAHSHGWYWGNRAEPQLHLLLFCPPAGIFRDQGDGDSTCQIRTQSEPNSLYSLECQRIW